MQLGIKHLGLSKKNSPPPCAAVSVSMPSDTAVGEGSGAVMVCAVLLGLIERNVDIVLTTEDGTAIREPH